MPVPVEVKTARALMPVPVTIGAVLIGAVGFVATKYLADAVAVRTKVGFVAVGAITAAASSLRAMLTGGSPGFLLLVC